MIPLKIGSSGFEVKQLQILLNTFVKSGAPLKADGYFGPRTAQVLKQFQALKKLAVDGAFGPVTRVAMGLKPLPTPVVHKPNAVGAPWLDIAVAEMGIQGDTAPGKNNDRIVEYHSTTSLKATDDETPWCSSFVNWVMKQAGYKGTGSAAAKSWMNWGSALQNPKCGAIAVIKRKSAGYTVATGSTSGFHVAFFISSTPAQIYLLGGNQHNQVRYTHFNLASFEVKSYQWPR
jgi:uncharacterized protein (TIGR02594 family)